MSDLTIDLLILVIGIHVIPGLITAMWALLGARRMGVSRLWALLGLLGLGGAMYWRFGIVENHRAKTSPSRSSAGRGR